MADKSHLNVLAQGVETWNSWRKQASTVPDLNETKLAGVDLHGADLSWADLGEANLSRTNLRGGQSHGG